MIDGKTFLEETRYFLTEHKITKLNAAAFVGKCALLAEENIISREERLSIIKEIKIAAGMTDEEVDEALFYRRGDDKWNIAWLSFNTCNNFTHLFNSNLSVLRTKFFNKFKFLLIGKSKELPELTAFANAGLIKPESFLYKFAFTPTDNSFSIWVKNNLPATFYAWNNCKILLYFIQLYLVTMTLMLKLILFNFIIMENLIFWVVILFAVIFSDWLTIKLFYKKWFYGIYNRHIMCFIFLLVSL